jgi:hypothetical protein
MSNLAGPVTWSVAFMISMIACRRLSAPWFDGCLPGRSIRYVKSGQLSLSSHLLSWNGKRTTPLGFYAFPGANCVQGAKAQQKRQRNADKSAPKGAKSQAKSNEAAKNIICLVCKQSFVRFFISFHNGNSK